jgi:hypothetical protein
VSASKAVPGLSDSQLLSVTSQIEVPSSPKLNDEDDSNLRRARELLALRNTVKLRHAQVPNQGLERTNQDIGALVTRLKEKEAMRGSLGMPTR